MRGSIFVLVLLGASFNAGLVRAQVSSQRLVDAAKEPQNWLTYSGDYAGRRHSALDQIGTSNVGRLRPQWVFQSEEKGKFETTPLVVDGVMYVTGQENLAYALDARTGRTIWRYQHPWPEDVRLCCGTVNRGLAVLGDKVFLATLDAHVVALDAKTGNVVWDVVAADYRKGHSFTLAPLAVKDKIIVGVAGGEFGIRGFIDAYDAETGKRAWRFYAIPGPGEPGHETWEGDSWKTGGSPAWLTGTYDPELNLTYWGIGNPGPDLYGEEREGDNLYSNCVVALDADTGKLKWYFQFTPHDVHDWDATQIPILLDLEFKGKPRKLRVQANRNAFYYVLDRTNGEFLHASAFARQTWAKEIDANGRPAVLPGSGPTPEGNRVCPGLSGATNWMSPSYSPQTDLFYVAVREQCDLYFNSPQPFREGSVFFGSTYQPPDGEKNWGALRALDPRTGEMKWEFKYYSAPWAGTLSTAGGVVFAGDMEGYLFAVDAQTGKELWHFQTGAPIYSSPMTYSLDGTQYVVIPSGSGLFSFALPEEIQAR